MSALFVGGLFAWGLERLIDRERRTVGLDATDPHSRRTRWLFVTLGFVVATVGLYVAELVLRCVEAPEVQPPDHAWQLRALYHALLAGFLLAATVIDLDCYLIPDAITLPGIAAGLLVAAVVQDMQIAHLWVDWSYAVPGLSGPFIPAWYDQHRTLHALACSAAGIVAGGGLTLLVRALSSRVLGQEAMGLGDVTLMAMIGSFLGWQAVVLTFAVAPLTGLVAALVGKVTANRPYLPYGPCLSAAALVVIINWRWLWAETRLMFSDLVGLALLGGIGIVAMALLLVLLRLYRSIPTRR